jgi:hypothetical protein
VVATTSTNTSQNEHVDSQTSSSAPTQLIASSISTDSIFSSNDINAHNAANPIEANTIVNNSKRASLVNTKSNSFTRGEKVQAKKSIMRSLSHNFFTRNIKKE